MDTPCKLSDNLFSTSYLIELKGSLKKCLMRIWPSTFVIFSEITLSKPFRIDNVIKRDEIPIDRPNTDKMVAVLTKPLL